MPARCVQTAPDQKRTDGYWSIVCDLISMIERTRHDQLVDEPGAAPLDDHDNVICLDDTATAHSAEIALLNDCNLRLREALHFLLEARAARRLTAAGWVDEGRPSGMTSDEIVA